MPIPAVLSSPQAFHQLKEGFDQLGELLTLTLGPVGGMVLSTSAHHDAPEPLNDAAIIARRILALPDQAQNVGAMLIRNMVWRVHQRVGDGGAITTALAQSLLDHAAQSVSAGANPVQVNQGIEKGVKAAVDSLQKMSQPVQGYADLIAIAHSVTMQTDLSLVLGEMFDILGKTAHITIENYLAPYLERTYITGGRWEAGLVSPYLVTAPTSRQAILQDAWVVIYDGDIREAGELTNLFSLAQAAVKLTQKPFKLLLIANEISGDALNTLVSAHTQGKGSQNGGFQIVAVKTKRPGEKNRADFIDLATLTGAVVVSPKMGRSLGHIQQGDLGYARRIVASSEELFVVEGKGSISQTQDQIQILQKQLQSVKNIISSKDKIYQDQIDEIEMRLARLSGSSAILKIGALTKAERNVLRQKAEQGVKVIKAAMDEGVILGGGVAYAHCISSVEAVSAKNEDERMGIHAVALALEAPFKKILKNARINAPGVILNDLLQGESTYVYDVIQKEIVEARSAGVLDATKVLRAALETASSGARLALSTGVIVLNRKPDIRYEP